MSIPTHKKEAIIALAAQVYVNFPELLHGLELKRDLYNVFIIKKMIARFIRTGNINDKLIMNNIIVSFNTFEPFRAVKIFKLALNDAEYAVLNSFLVFLDLHSSDESTNEIIDGILQDTAVRFKLRYKYE